jgi:hypothetical protein
MPVSQASKIWLEYQRAHSKHNTVRAYQFTIEKFNQNFVNLTGGFEVGPEPMVTVATSYMTEIEWLAGRGYNTLGVRFPAIFNGRKDRAFGDFLSVLWENLADPIITGRDELGFSKIYCELPEPKVYQSETHCVANWLGFKFMDLKLKKMKQIPPENFPLPASGQTEGKPTGIQYKVNLQNFCE